MTLDANSSLYRRGVGVMLLNADGKVWVGARIDNPADAWQMPQGGDRCRRGAVGDGASGARGGDRDRARLVERVAQCPERLRYSLPPELVGVIWKEPWLGQEQDWFLCRFLGEDSDVNIATEHPEFREWKWIDPERLPDVIVPFKRELYARLLREFAQHL